MDFLCCPSCNSPRIWKDGFRYKVSCKIQRYLCRDCSYRFSHSERSELSESHQEIRRQSLNSDSTLFFTRQVGVSQTKAMINLATVDETRNQEKAAGATKPDPATTKGKILEHAFWQEKNAYKASTIAKRTYQLNVLAKLGANLLDPESVKETIAKLQVIEDTKAQYVATYDLFAFQNKIAWIPPPYRQYEKIPFIPTEAELDQIIAAGKSKTAALLQLLKETAMRIGEAWSLKWTDIDFERKIIRLNDPEKHSNPRIFNVSSKLIDMLNKVPRKSDKVFGYVSLENYKHTFLLLRKRLAQNLQNPRILQITFHTFRHWRATMLYHKTRDPLYVMQFLGHRDIKNTLRYIHIEKTLFNSENDEFHVKVAQTLDEACKLVEVGFEYITEMQGTKIFRKRK